MIIIKFILQLIIAHQLKNNLYKKQKIDKFKS